jgi:F-type H+-transporting ATPase subunit gamma
MKAVAASSIGQYEKSTAALADYYRTVELGLGVLLRENGKESWITRRKGPPSRIVAVVFGSDQGLVGRFNEIVTDYAVERIAALPVKPQIWAVGERVYERLHDTGLSVAGRFEVPGSVKTITSLVGRIFEETDAGSSRDNAVGLELFYNRSGARTVCIPVGQRLLPLDEDWRRGPAELSWPTNKLPEVLGGIRTLRAFIGEYLFVAVYRACAESLASENASRLSAMQRAEKNIEELLEEMNRSFHRLRQSGIDEELFDVISGFEALNA